MTVDTETLNDSIQPDRLRDLLGSFPLFTKHTRERGEDYAENGRVIECSSDDGRISSRVLGGEVYETEWQWYDGEWDCACSCPIEVYCKHAYAVALRVLSDAAKAGFRDPRLENVLPGRDSQAAAPEELGHDDGWDDHESALVTLREAREVWQRESALDQLLSDAPVLVSPYAPGFAEILEEADPDLLCWRIAQKIVREAGGWLPADLEQFRDRGDLSKRFAGRERDSLANELLAWAGDRRIVPRRRLRLAFALTPVTEVSAQLVFEVHATTARLSNVSRNFQQLQQIRAEQRREADSLLPEHAALLEWVLTNAVPAGTPGGDRFTSTRSAALLDWVADNPNLAVWAPDLDQSLAQRIGIEAGKPVRMERRPLRVVPNVAPREDGLGISLALAWPDGREEPLDHRVLFLEPLTAAGGLVFCAGAFHPLSESPPTGLLAGFATVPELSLDGEGRARALNLLTSRFPNVARTISSRTRIYPATPIVAFDLREDDWLHARVFACRKTDSWKPGQPVSESVKAFEWGSEVGWVPLEPSAAPDGSIGYDDVTGQQTAAEEDAAAAADAEDVWLELPDPADVSPTLDWLESVPMWPRSLEPDAPAEPGEGGWWLRVNQRRMNDFAEAWGNRPAGAHFVGTRSVRHLLGATRRVRPRMRIRKTGIDWFAVSAELEAEGQSLTAEQLLMLRRSTSRFVKLGSEWVSKDAIAGYDQSSSLLAEIGLDPTGGEQRLSMWQLAGASDQALDELQAMGADAETVAAVKQLREKIESFDGIPSVPVPPFLVGELRDYQKRGLDFLVHTSALGLGPVLADDMGLGKTIQALSWLQHLVDEKPDGGPTLVVCPASVVHVWKREAARFTPKLKVMILGRGRERFRQWDEIAESDLVVTNYALLRRDIARWGEMPLRAFVLDEAQNIKNPDTAVAKAARSLEARHRVALTGTPLENRPLDVWSIVSCLNPGYLGTRNEFQDRYNNPEHPESAYKLLSAKLRPILLRRTKDQVAPELPDRIEERLECEMTVGQRQLYMAELKRSRERVFDLADDDTGFQRNRVAVLAVLTRLRQICCHPSLVGADYSLGSGKFDNVLALIDSLLAEGHKVLLFSQFVECLKLLATELDQRSMRYHMLTGSTRNREEVVSAFQNGPDPSVFLISLKAGGTGLNLTSASYVVLFDPWWNPAVEAQAIDRTHRIGQSRTVIAYRMATRGTIEEKIWELQERKAKMLRDVLSEQSFAGALTRDDLAYILEDPE